MSALDDALPSRGRPSAAEVQRRLDAAVQVAEAYGEVLGAALRRGESEIVAAMAAASSKATAAARHMAPHELRSRRDALPVDLPERLLHAVAATVKARPPAPGELFGPRFDPEVSTAELALLIGDLVSRRLTPTAAGKVLVKLVNDGRITWLRPYRTSKTRGWLVSLDALRGLDLGHKEGGAGRLAGCGGGG